MTDLQKRGKYNAKYTTLSIEVGNNDFRTLVVTPTSEPGRIAYNFCKENNLDYESLQMLTDKLQSVKLNTAENANSNEPQKFKKIKSKPNIRKPNQFENSLGGQNNLETRSFNVSPNNTKSSVSKIKKSNTNLLGNKSTNYPNYTKSNKKMLKNRTEVTLRGVNNLYEQPSRMNSVINKSRISNNSYKNNFGEQMYYRAMKIETNKQMKLNKLKNNIIKKEKCTFKPKINPVNYNVMLNRTANHKACNDSDNIINYREIKQNKINSLRIKYLGKDQCKEYTFKPTINPNSKKIDEHKNSQTNRYNKLYHDQKASEIRRKTLTNQIYGKNMFKPEINNDYNFELKNLPFQQRMEKYRSKSSEKQKILNTEPNFMPTINHNFSTNRINNDIFNDLYNRALHSKIEKERLAEDYYERNYCQDIHTNVESNEILFKKFEKNYKNLYNILRKNKEEVLNPSNLELTNLPKNIFNIMKPIFDELLQENQSLNEDEFIRVCFQLSLTLEFPDKKSFENFVADNENKKKRNSEIENNKVYSFKPQINKTNLNYLNNKKKKNL